MTRQLLVTHPGRQHSHRAAMAFEKAGRLAAYWAGVPSSERHRGIVPVRLWRRFVRYEPLPLPDERTRAAAWIPALRRLGDRLPRPLAARIDLAACRAFDRWVARRLGRTEAGAVLACEISALETFHEARRRGWVTLLDAPSFHHAAQDRLHGFSEPPEVHRRIVAIKDREIALADAVVTVSALARSTYVEAGVPEEKVLAIPLGADGELFGGSPGAGQHTGQHAEHLAGRRGEVRFLFAGAPIARKGFDLLIAALERLVASGVPFHLRLVGSNDEQSALARRLPRASWSAAGPLPQRGLAAELAAADCLVLPSRNDSYGMVVAEALAAGRPVVVSSMVGAAELVAEGVEGWVVPVGDVAALAARLTACALDPEALRARASACRDKARTATWEAYEARLLLALLPILDRQPA